MLPQVLYGRSFCEKYGSRVIPGFRQWVENIANGELVRLRPPPPPHARRVDGLLSMPLWQVGFFAELGDCLREAIAEQLAHPERYAEERSVMRVYLEARRRRTLAPR